MNERAGNRMVSMGVALGVGLFLLVGLLVGLGGLNAPAPALAQTDEPGGIGAQALTGIITGRVTINSPTGLPISGAWVSIYDNITADHLITTTTDVNGVYSATVHAPSDAVKVRFVMTGCSELYYDGSATFEAADPVTLSLVSPISNINAALAQTSFGAITGTVTDASSSNPISLTAVTAYNAGSHAVVRTAFSNNSGVYQMQNLSAGTYKVGFYKMGYAGQYYFATDTIAQATVLTVGLSTTISNVNAALEQPTGCISGTVVAASNSFPLHDVTATVIAPKSPTLLVTRTMGVTLTGTSPAGGYQICGLEGDYIVQFRKRLYVPQWYDEQFSTDTADLVSVLNGQTTDPVDGALYLGGCVSGWVEDQAGTVQPTATVTVYNTSGVPVGVAVPPPPLSDETYRVCQLPGGDYEVRCTDTGMSGSADVTIPAGHDVSQTCVMTGTPPGPTTGCISGTVRAQASGALMSGVTVNLYTSTGTSVVSTTLSDITGGYLICDLAGVYRVEFSKTGYLPNYYDNRTSLALADPVTVTAGATSLDTDAALVRDPFASIPIYMPLIMKNE